MFNITLSKAFIWNLCFLNENNIAILDSSNILKGINYASYGLYIITKLSQTVKKNVENDE